MFDEKGHTYTAENSDLYTGCTTISEAWKKDFLGPWYAKEMYNFLSAPTIYEVLKAITPDEYLKLLTEAKGAARRKGDEAQITGKNAHAWMASAVEAKILGKKQYKPPKLVNQEAENAVNAFIGWVKNNKIEWLASEEVVANHEHKVAGTLDAIAVVDGITYLVDFKTSGQISSSYLIQCAGYDLMLREMGLQVMGYMVLRTPKDGKPAETLTITDQTDMQFFRDTFLKQREAHKFYAYMESKFKDAIGKMKVDEVEIANITIPKRGKVVLNKKKK